MPVISLNGHEIAYKLNRSTRGKHLRMEFGPTGAKLSAPKNISNQEIIKFIFEQKKWLLKRHLAYQNPSATKLHWPKDYTSGEFIPFLGDSLSLDVKFSERPIAPTMVQKSLRLTLPLASKLLNINQASKKLAISWLKLQAKNHVQRFVNYYSQTLGRKPSGVTLKLQHRRWGSCGIHDHIYINWLLIVAPLPVLEYVVLHECCHLFYRNHGPRFWALVAKHMPNYKQQEKWLKEHSGLVQPPN